MVASREAGGGNRTRAAAGDNPQGSTNSPASAAHSLTQTALGAKPGGGRISFSGLSSAFDFMAANQAFAGTTAQRLEIKQVGVVGPITTIPRPHQPGIHRPKNERSF